MRVGKFGRATAIGMSLLLVVGAGVAFADDATDLSVSINGGDATTDSLNVTVTVGANHCPPGGDMNALEIYFRNNVADAWTIVKADGALWDPTDEESTGCDGGSGSSPDPATRDFAWTLAAGDAGLRTVLVRFRHGSDNVFDEDTIQYVVASFTFDGFYQPVGDHTTATNGFFVTAKAGQGVALKWNLLDSEEEPVTEGTWTAKSTKYTDGCFYGSNGDDPNTVPDAGSAGSSDFRYDPDGDGQWIFVWKTNKGWANTCRTFELSYNGSPVAELDVHFTK